MRKYVIITDGDDGWAVYLTKDGSFSSDRRKAKRFFTEKGARRYLYKEDSYTQAIANIDKI